MKSRGLGGALSWWRDRTVRPFLPDGCCAQTGVLTCFRNLEQPWLFLRKSNIFLFGGSMDFSEVIELEKKLLDSYVRKNAEELNALLSPDFVEFGTSGRIYDKQIIIERLPKEAPTLVEAFDFTGVFLAPDIVQLRFKTKRKNEDGTISASLRSSIWRRSEGRWRMFFHQGTAASP